MLTWCLSGVCVCVYGCGVCVCVGGCSGCRVIQLARSGGCESPPAVAGAALHRQLGGVEQHPASRPHPCTCVPVSRDAGREGRPEQCTLPCAHAPCRCRHSSTGAATASSVGSHGTVTCCPQRHRRGGRSQPAPASRDICLARPPACRSSRFVRACRRAHVQGLHGRCRAPAAATPSPAAIVFGPQHASHVACGEGTQERWAQGEQQWGLGAGGCFAGRPSRQRFFG